METDELPRYPENIRILKVRHASDAVIPKEFLLLE
jgi:hypothetical protein